MIVETDVENAAGDGHVDVKPPKGAGSQRKAMPGNAPSGLLPGFSQIRWSGGEPLQFSTLVC